MKKEYKDLEVEVVDFAADDVITASGGCDCDCPTVKVIIPCNPMECLGVLTPCPHESPCIVG